MNETCCISGTAKNPTLTSFHLERIAVKEIINNWLNVLFDNHSREIKMVK